MDKLYTFTEESLLAHDQTLIGGLKALLNNNVGDFISIRTATQSDITVKSGANNTGSIPLSLDGYLARCVVGWNFDNSSSGGVGASLARLFELYVNQSAQKCYFGFRNTNDSSIKVDLKVYILYTKVMNTGGYE